MGCPWPYHSPWEVEGRENWCTHYTTRKETQGGCFAYEEVSATLSALPLLLTAGYWHMREEGERGPRWTGRVSPPLKERYHKLKKERFHPSLWSQAASLWIEGLTPDNFSCSVTHKSCCWVVFTYLNDASPCVRVCVLKQKCVWKLKLCATVEMSLIACCGRYGTSLSLSCAWEWKIPAWSQSDCRTHATGGEF